MVHQVLISVTALIDARARARTHTRMHTHARARTHPLTHFVVHQVLIAVTALIDCAVDFRLAKVIIRPDPLVETAKKDNPLELDFGLPSAIERMQRPRGPDLYSMYMKRPWLMRSELIGVILFFYERHGKLPHELLTDLRGALGVIDQVEASMTNINMNMNTNMMPTTTRPEPEPELELEWSAEEDECIPETTHLMINKLSDMQN